MTDAAIRVLGSQGLRQLTHRAVDAEAGLPAGSTSNHFRTREALLAGIVARLNVLDRGDWERMVAPTPAELSYVNVDVLVRLVADFARGAVSAQRDRTLARHALMLEASLRPELQEELSRGSDEVVRWGAAWLRAVGSPDPEWHCRILLDHLDGIMLHQLAFGAPDFDPAPSLRLLLRAMLVNP